MSEHKTTYDAPPTQSTSGMMNQAEQTADRARDQARAAADTARQRADEMADQAARRSDQGMDKAAEGLDRLAGTIRDKSQATGGGTIQHAAATTADRLETASTYLRDKDTDHLIQDLEAFVRRRPVESLLAAAGAGFLLARAVR